MANEAAGTIRNVSDTAVWVAMYRARESERAGALFHDPYARRLAGERGEAIVAAMRGQDRNQWAYVARTVLFDRFVTSQVAAGADTVINLAAGLDARPYRMDLPSSLRWIEVDFPDLIAYKESILAKDQPKCRLERVGIDLANAEARQAFFKRIGAESKRVLILSEGLLVYLGADGASSLARDLAAEPSFRWWVFDIASPGLLKLLNKQLGTTLITANAPLLFAPIEGPWFFEPLGWKVLDVQGSLKNAARMMKLPLLFRFFALFPEKRTPGNQPWAGICLLENERAA